MRATSDSKNNQKEDTEKPLRYSVKGKRMRFFESQGVDELVSICMSLAQELWVYRERQAAIEDFLHQKKIILDDELAKHNISDEKRSYLKYKKNHLQVCLQFYISLIKAQWLGPLW